MIQISDNIVHIQTKNTSYIFIINEYKHLEHIYYGERLEHININSMRQNVHLGLGNMLMQDESNKQYSLEILPQELSSSNSDIRRSFIHLDHQDSSIFDFTFVSATHLDTSYDDNLQAQTHDADEVLKVVVEDVYHQIQLSIYYRIFYTCDVITRYTTLTNLSQETATIQSLMALQLDLNIDNLVLERFDGHWIKEMQRHEQPIVQGTHIIESRYGVSSNRHQPFFIFKQTTTQEDYGACFAFNSVYSGNHYASIEVNGFNQQRVLIGYHPDYLQYPLLPNTSFTSYEAIMSYSATGLTTLSKQMHEFVRKHILPKTFQTQRPVLLNSWESFYFNVSQNKMKKLAKAASKLGFECVVLDDGWFGERNDDTTSLGDYHINKKRFHDMKQLVNDVHDEGLLFGIWVEPEMISEASKLYKEHPEYALKSNNKQPIGRNQYILDLHQEDVVTYIIKQMEQVIDYGIDYIKWDMNRIFSEQYSNTYKTTHNYNYYYVRNLYRILHHIQDKYPNLIIETCASGGNRFDLGMLCYSHQIWASDNSDAVQRQRMQQAYSFGYPNICFTSHVSSAINHQTLRKTSFDTRFHVAMSANLGFELNILDANKKEQQQIQEAITLYKQYRDVILQGDYYRCSHSNSPYDVCIVSKDQSKALYFHYGQQTPSNPALTTIYPKGLVDDGIYHFYNVNKKMSLKVFGDLVNQVAPIHIKVDSVLHNLADRFMSFKQEQEDYTVSGKQLMVAGMVLKQAYPSVGYDEHIRIMLDYDTRLYIIERVE